MTKHTHNFTRLVFIAYWATVFVVKKSSVQIWTCKPRLLVSDHDKHNLTAMVPFITPLLKVQY